MASKLVTDRQKSATLVAEAGKTHAERIRAAALELFKPHVPRGETAPDLAVVARAATRALESARDAMVAADEAHLRELADDEAPREERDALAAELQEKVVIFREMLVGIYGREATSVLGLNGETPRDPVQISRFAGMMADRLVSGMKLPAARVRGARLDLSEWAEDFGALRKKLDVSLAKVAKEVREAEGSLLAKTRAIEAYDATFSRVASLLSALLGIAGDEELARKVRPSARRPGQVADPEAVSSESPSPTDVATPASAEPL